MGNLREKVIKGLECCYKDEMQHCADCPYVESPDDDLLACTGDVIADALELLKAQEPKNPNLGQDVSGIYAVCPRCGKKIQTLFAKKVKLEFPMPKFCKYCGQEVKWDG